MKTVTSLLLFLITPFILTAQGVFSNHTNAALQEVIQDYPHHFTHIKGELITSRAEVSDYRSRVEIPGAVNCVITEYSAASNGLYNWQCELFTANSFADAQQKFRASYDQIRNMIIRIDDQAFILSGKYEAPAQAGKTTAIYFNMLPSPEDYQKLKIVLSLHYSQGWKILLSVYDQERPEDHSSVAVQ